MSPSELPIALLRTYVEYNDTAWFNFELTLKLTWFWLYIPVDVIRKIGPCPGCG